VHADLPGVEWNGTEAKVHESAAQLGIAPANVIVVRAQKTFFEMVERRGMWPSPSLRQCTSDLKRDPIAKAVRAIAKARGASLVINCMGLRAAESCSRSKLETYKLNKKASCTGRTVMDWLPIHHYSTAEVFETIARSGQTPHWAYAAGMTRLSCMFCVMGSDQDTKTAATLNPEALAAYVALERKIGQTFKMPKKGIRTYLDGTPA